MNTARMLIYLAQLLTPCSLGTMMPNSRICHGD